MCRKYKEVQTSKSRGSNLSPYSIGHLVRLTSRYNATVSPCDSFLFLSSVKDVQDGRFSKMHKECTYHGCAAFRQIFVGESSPFRRPKRECAPELGIYGFQGLESLSGYSISEFSVMK